MNKYPKNLAEARRMIDELRGNVPSGPALANGRPERTEETLASARALVAGKRELLKQAVTLDGAESLLHNLRGQLEKASGGESRLTVLSQGERLAKAEIKRLQANPSAQVPYFRALARIQRQQALEMHSDKAAWSKRYSQHESL